MVRGCADVVQLLAFIDEHGDDVLSSTDFLKLPHTLVRLIVARDSLQA